MEGEGEGRGGEEEEEEEGECGVVNVGTETVTRK